MLVPNRVFFLSVELNGQKKTHADSSKTSLKCLKPPPLGKHLLAYPAISLKKNILQVDGTSERERFFLIKKIPKNRT